MEGKTFENLKYPPAFYTFVEMVTIALQGGTRRVSGADSAWRISKTTRHQGFAIRNFVG